MPDRRRKFDRQFKLDALRLVERGDRSIAAIARELGIHPNSLLKWRDQVRVDGTDAFPGKGKLKPADEELRRLRRELEAVTEERDILKKPWPCSHGESSRVPLHPGAESRSVGPALVPNAQGEPQRVLPVAGSPGERPG
jgi:transposase